ncbi:MBL fold metallo-hydrolase [Nocardiopsis alba]|uniref:Metallo-beta-lactamase superfamily protein n=1 Tax=Nocardiopsis alba (strain ATCC BAA-2165 / BE74) TaxID=1205910 RepID=J7LG64_NOCAA|nr:MBL fold metallo-hydrolase [Nocardiopsis alba]AFR10450.1 metallo-beta-lactamase superfamily protein [Nocardiopsis alba ATCC BAA-2165]
MFWKRKPKKQEGHEATDSAVEVAEDTEEKVDDAVGSEDTDTEETTEKAATEDRSADETETADEKADSDESASDDTDEKADEDAKEAKTEDSEEEDEVVEVGVTGPDADGITRVRTAGTFEFDGEKSEIISNTWIVEADKDGVVVIDPAHDAEAILKVVGDREVYLVACTNAYSPHIEAALTIAEETEADIALHPREMRAWRRVHGAEHRPEIEVEGGGSFDVGDLHIDVLPLPGTSPGTVGYYVSQLGAVFGGDTLRKGEPGMVGGIYIDYTTQLASIGENLLTLPPDTRILPDRGPSTTVEAESRNFDAWV